MGVSILSQDSLDEPLTASRLRHHTSRESCWGHQEAGCGRKGRQGGLIDLDPFLPSNHHLRPRPSFPPSPGSYALTMAAMPLSFQDGNYPSPFAQQVSGIVSLSLVADGNEGVRVSRLTDLSSHAVLRSSE